MQMYQPSQFFRWAGRIACTTLSTDREQQGESVVSARQPGYTPKAAPTQDAELSATPHDVAVLAHELRRRMAAMRMLGEAIALFQRQGLDLSTMLERLLGEIDELDDLTKAVLDDDRWRGPADSTKGADVVAAVQAAARTVAAARGAIVRVDADGPVEVPASATMLRQAVENLIDNAVVHGGSDVVEVGVRVDSAAGHVEVLVADSGAPERTWDGQGIGLFLVRRFLDDVGGWSRMEKRRDGGTVVAVSLPMRPPGAGGRDQLGSAVNT